MIKASLHEMGEDREKRTFRDLCRDIRVAITGKTVGPPLFKSMEILGKKECMKRLKKVYEKTKVR